MPRGPFQGTFQPNIRPTVVTAPDAVVMINGETDLIGCPSCRRRFNLNRYITSITADLSVDSIPGSASINMSIPRHSIDEFYFDGVPVLTPMMEVEIYAKGYYLVGGVPQYYPIFWGLITEVSDSYSGGEHSVTIQCADILKWWEICKMNINPAFTAPAGQKGRSIFGNVFFGTNPYDVIWSLAQHSFGDVLIGTGSLVSLNRDAGGQKPIFDAALSDMMLYWQERFSRMRSNLLLYGTNGVAVRGDSLYESYKSGKYGSDRFASTAVRSANGGLNASQMVFDPADPEVVAFRTQFNQAGQVNFWQSEYQTKLELANAAKEAIGFEFYMDVTGDLVFKPPFYNLDILSNKPVSWIQDIDIIDWDFSESEAEVVTQLSLQGSYGGNVDYGFPADVTPMTSVTDYHLLRKYGWRSQTYNSEFMGNPLLMFYHGLDILDRMNSKRHRATVSIPMRPELRLGFPIYIAPKDQVWYISGISHNLSFGGRAQTSLTLTARRQKFIAPKGIGTIKMTGYKSASTTNQAGGKAKAASTPKTNLPFPYSSRQLAKGGTFEVKIGDAAQTPPAGDAAKVSDNNPYDPMVLRHPKTGRIVGCPNVVMAYTRPFIVPPDQLKKNAGQGSPAKNYLPSSKDVESEQKQFMDKQAPTLEAGEADRLRDKHLNNRYNYGINSAGVYIYLIETKSASVGRPVIGEVVMLPSANLKTDPEEVTVDGKAVKPFPGGSSMIRPVSDERGFEVVGHFRYGRGLALRDGQLIYQPGSTNAKASVDLQLALSGDLFATLQAQSSGLTALVSAYPNPAATLSRLEPDDLQSAGYINPETKEPEFVDGGNPMAVTPGTNFMDAAPMGSPEQKGLPSTVEAGQLSRALTLAELAVVDKNGAGGSDDECMCLLGRADLAFMNVGYQVKTLNGAVPDASSLFGVNTFGQSTSEGVAVGGSTTTGTALALNQPVPAQSVSPSVSEVSTQVDEFLYSLYSALDDSHQAYEAEIRGDAFTTNDKQLYDNLINGQPQDNPERGLRPPFSAEMRSTLGDPMADVLQASSAKQDLVRTWDAFSKKLQDAPYRKLYEGQIAQAESEIARLEERLAELESTKSGDYTIIGVPSVDEQIKIVQEDIAKFEKQKADAEKKLADLGPAPRW